jgi:hypothetical protein
VEPVPYLFFTVPVPTFDKFRHLFRILLGGLAND